MTDYNIDTEDEDLNLGKKNKGLNIITILTIIGSVFFLGLQLLGEMNMDQSYQQHLTVQNGGTTGSDWADQMLINSWDTFQVTYENRYLILSVNVIGILLCLFGAILMRRGQLKGLWIWLTGEWLPLVPSLALLGFSFLQGWQLSFLLIPVLFTILYFAHKKYLA